MELELVFRILDFIIHLVKPVIKVCLAFHVVLIIRFEGINLLHQSCLYGITLPKLLFMRRDLLLNGRGIHLYADLFLHHGGELRITYQLYDNLYNSAVQQLFIFSQGAAVKRTGVLGTTIGVKHCTSNKRYSGF